MQIYWWSCSRVGMSSGDLAKELFDSLVRNKRLKVVGATLLETIDGTGESRVGLGEGLSLGQFAVKNPLLGESDNILSQAFWSRFIVTLDFGNGMLYLKKGKHYDRPDLYDLSGLHLLREEGKTYVGSVDKGSLSAAKGMKRGDRILRMGTEPVEKVSMFELRKALARPGETVHLTLQRGSEEIALELGLK
jgi:hypothetical protein